MSRLRKDAPLFICAAILLVATYCYFKYSILSRVVPDMVSGPDGKVMVMHQPDKDEKIERVHRIRLSVVPPFGNKVVFHHKVGKDGEFVEKELRYVEECAGYATTLEPLEVGERYFYYFTVGEGEKTIYMPETAREDVEGRVYYYVTYEAHTTEWLLIVHIVMMLMSFVLLIHAFFYAVKLLIRDGKGFGGCYRAQFWGWLTFFVSACVIGPIITIQTFGPPGFAPWPFFGAKSDVTDTKSLYFILLWAAFLLSMKGTLLKRGEEKDLLSKKVFAVLTLAGFVLAIVVYLLIPHSYFVQ